MRNIPTVKRFNLKPGIYHNESLGLISLSSDGENWMTILDKNLGATEVYHRGDTITSQNFGGYFQRGNNHMFSFDGPRNTSTDKVNSSGLSVNSYSNDTFIITDIVEQGGIRYLDYWLDPYVTLRNDSVVSVLSPLDNVNFTHESWEKINTIITNFGLSSESDISKTGYPYLLMPAHSSLTRGEKDTSNPIYWTSSSNSTNAYYACPGIPRVLLASCSYGCPIRLVLNNPVIPDSKRTVLYQPN